MEQPRSQGDEFLEHAVVMVQYADLVDGHEHVSRVDTLKPDGTERRWTAVELLNAIRGGERFAVTIGGIPTSTVLEPAICPVCPVNTLNYRSRGTASSAGG